MGRYKFVDGIKLKQNVKTISIIGEIDISILDSNRIESVYYSFPLIERLVLEIYKLVPGADVEYYDQGTMRTTNSLIDENNELHGEKIIPEETVKLIKKYFADDGPRNKIFHVTETAKSVGIFLTPINYIIMNLLEVLNNLIEKHDSYRFKNIDELV